MAITESTSNVVREVAGNPVDPRFLKRMGAREWAEQPSGYLNVYGGASGYSKLTKLPIRERLTYKAVLEGNSTTDEIATVTGLTTKEVDKALVDLQKVGLVATEETVLEPIK